jgi:predicted PurR-regulated permease PerM
MDGLQGGSMSDVQPETPADEHVISQRQVITMVRWLLYMAFVVIAFLILRRVAPIITPVLAAAGIAYLLDPVVDRLEDRGMKRVLAVALLLVLFLGTVAGCAILLVPLIAGDAARFVQEMPVMVEAAAGWIAVHLGYEVPASWQAYLSSEQVGAVLRQMAGPVSEIAAAALGSFFGLLGFLAELLIIPVFAFYFLVDWDRMVARLRSMIPPRHRGPVVDVVREIDSVVSGWIRGQLTVTSLLAILYAACFYALDLQLAITMGLLVGLLTIIPFLGTFVGLAITLGLVLLDWQGFGHLAAVGMVFVVLHLIEAAMLTPKLVGKRVGLGETGALFAVLAGGQLLGFSGVLLAVPLAAGVAVLLRRLLQYYERSEFFGAADADHSARPPKPTDLA